MTARLTTAVFLAVVQLFASNSALAEDQIFDAICLPEKKKCRIRVSTTEFKFEDGTILPVRRVISWGKAGKGTRPDIGGYTTLIIDFDDIANVPPMKALLTDIAPEG